MADLFSSLVGEVLGAAPQITPLLPPLFSPWPGLPSTNGEPPRPPQAEISAPAASTGDHPASLQASLPPALVDPSRPAAQAPLPTLRQMAARQPSLEPPFQPGQEPAAQRSPETAGFEPGQPSQAPGQPEPPARPSPLPDLIQGGTPPSPARPAAVIQTFPDPSAQRPAPASPAALPTLPSPALPASPRLSAAGEPSQALPEPFTPPPPALAPEQPVSPPSPAAPSAPPEPAQARPEPAAHFDLHRVNPPESIEPRLAPALARHDPESITTQPPSARPAPIPAKVQGQTVEMNRPPVEAPPRRADSPLAPAAARPEPAKNQADPGQSQAAPHNGREISPPDQPGRAASLPAPLEIPVQPALERVDTLDPLPGHASAPPAENLSPRGDQPQPAPAGAPLQPAAPADLRATTPAAAGPREVTVSTRNASARERVSTTRSAGSPERAPEILPAPDPAQGRQRPADALVSAKSPPPPAARPSITSPEPAPTVRVTIGRVVVRASAPAGETRSKQVDLPRPRLSLDDYLKGKKEGEP